MSQKIKSMSDEQIFIAAVAYETSGCQLPMEEFMQRISERYHEADKAYHNLRQSYVRVGSKDKLGI